MTNIDAKYIYFLKAKTIQVSFNGYMINQTMVHVYNEMLFSNKKEQSIDTTVCMGLKWNLL